ncbi:hypothetical protein DdX_20265 [Ditylenchus destructor]|uniref:MRG domain-containing protein n=1 Tax=Ditylenchus destructor TaxID=166010 RepID=A0AAD4QRX5_9BILA|nr:hypothetical protein DdX_20265 [Ditylenchus destructor]
MPSKKKATKSSDEWNIGDEVLCKTGQYEQYDLKYAAKIVGAIQYTDHLVYTVKYKGYAQTEDIPHVLALDRFSRLTPESKAQAVKERNIAKKQEKRAKSTSRKKRQITRNENIDASANNETEADAVVASDAFEFELAPIASASEDLPMLPVTEQFHIDENIHGTTSKDPMGASSSAIVTNEFSSELGQAANVSENDDRIEQLHVDNYDLSPIRLTRNLVALLKREESFVNQYLPVIPARVSVETMLKKFCDVQIFRNLHNGYHLADFKDDFLQMFDSFDWKKIFTDFEAPMFEDFFSGKSAYQGISSLKPKWVANAEGNNTTGPFTFSSQLGITYLVRFLAKFHDEANKLWTDNQNRAFKSYADAFAAFISDHMNEFFKEIDDMYPISVAYYERTRARNV